jgi:hypothetical protein
MGARRFSLPDAVGALTDTLDREVAESLALIAFVAEHWPELLRPRRTEIEALVRELQREAGA